jgi:hypothetical protein
MVSDGTRPRFCVSACGYNLTLSAGGLALLCYIFGSLLYFWIFWKCPIFYFYFLFFTFWTAVKFSEDMDFEIWGYLRVVKFWVKLDLGG